MISPQDMAATHAAAFSRERPWSAQEFAAFLEQPQCFALGDANSFALARVILDEAELLTIATHPTQQGRGLARTCMAAWMAEAQARGATRAFLEVAADNGPALALYAACGFESCGLRRGYYRRENAAPADAVIMSRDLPPRHPPHF